MHLHMFMHLQMYGHLQHELQGHVCVYVSKVAFKIYALNCTNNV